MSAIHKKRYCVWKNGTDELIAIDEPANRCAELMWIPQSTFYIYLSRCPKAWTIIRSEEIERENEQ